MANDSDESDSEQFFTPPEIQKAAATAVESLLPTKSRDVYENAYFDFTAWKSSKNIASFSERVFLAYFQTLSHSKTSTLWSLYSKLNAVLKVRHNLNIENFYQLKRFLKKHGENYTPKLAKIFSANEIENFLTNTPDSQYSAMKVIN